jgi:FAD dependent oxidoreductase
MTQNNFIYEPERKLPVTAQYDIVVVGGGIAGVAAAVAAARLGSSVCLLEKEYGLGGLATLGIVTIWLPLCDGMGNQVIGGIGEELLLLAEADNTSTTPICRESRRYVQDCWKNPESSREERKETGRYFIEFAPIVYQLALEKMLLDEGVKLMYDTRLCAVECNNDMITHLIVENKGGRSAIACGAVVDASGDADVCAFSGEPVASVDTNVCSAWYYYLTPDELKIHPLSKPYFKPDDRTFSGVDPDDVTAQILESRQMIRAAIEEHRKSAGTDDVMPFLIPSIPAFRMTRRLNSDFVLDEKHIGVDFDDCVGLTGDWRKHGPVYSIPLRAIAGKVNGNLLTAGRCISSCGDAWDVTRAIPTCTVTGHAAGVAAALCVTDQKKALDLEVKRLQDVLRSQNAIIGPVPA